MKYLHIKQRYKVSYFNYKLGYLSDPSVESPWNHWTKSMKSEDKIHGIHEQSPAGVLDRKQRTISSESMENVHGFFSSMSIDFFHEIYGFSMESMDFVQGDSGQNPWK